VRPSYGTGSARWRSRSWRCASDRPWGGDAILALREESRRAIGDAFDERAFHDVVWNDGVLNLDELERHVREWVAETGAAPPERARVGG
jgi:hypothetical protein